MAAELVAFVLANAPQTASPSRDCPSDPGIPSNPKAALAKIDIRSQIRQQHL
jgi:hypothetical protein